MKRIIFITILHLIFCISAFAQTDKSDCPQVRIYGLPRFLNYGEQLVTFSVKVFGDVSKFDIKYKWKIENGYLPYWNDTDTILISPAYDKIIKDVKATVEIKGLPQNCQNSFSEKIEILQKNAPRLITVSKTSSTILSDLDSLFIELNNEVKLFGVIKIESSSKNNILKRIKIIQRKFAFRCKIDTSRFLYAISLNKNSKKNKVEYWVTQKKYEIPDCYGCIFVESTGAIGTFLK